MSQFEGEKYEYCLQVHGPMFNMPSIKAEGLKPGKHYFDTVAQLWYFFAELQIMAHNQKAPPLPLRFKRGAQRSVCNDRHHSIYARFYHLPGGSAHRFYHRSRTPQTQTFIARLWFRMRLYPIASYKNRSAGISTISTW